MKNLLLLFALVSSVSLSATHLLGGQLSAQCADDPSTSDLEYNVTFILIRDASGITLDTSQAIEISGGGSTFSVTLQDVLRQIVTTGSRTVEIVTYQGIALLQPNTGYRMAWGLCCRPAGIINIPQSLSQSMYYWSDLHTGNSCNSTPQFIAPPIMVWPYQVPWVGSVAAFDNDGDQLKYSLDVPYQGSVSQHSQITGYTLPNYVAGGMPTIDTLFGTFTYNSDSVGSYSLVYEVEASDTVMGVNSVIRRDVYLEVIPATGNLIQVNSALPQANPHYEFPINIPDTLVYTGSSNSPLIAELFLPEMVDSNKVDFWFNQYKTSDSVDVFFSYRPNIYDIGVEFPAVIRFDNGVLTWDEVVFVGAKNDVGVEKVKHVSAYMFPNPSDGQFKVVFDGKMNSVRIVESTGRVVADEDLSHVQSEWSAELNIPAGVYFVQFVDGNGQMWVEPLIIK